MNLVKKTDIISAMESLIEASYEIGIRIKQLDYPSETELADCQQLAISIGSALEQRPEDLDPVYRALEDFCEEIYQLTLTEGDKSFGLARAAYKSAVKAQLLALDIIPDDRKEVVFLPYKADMWDSLESVWIAANEDPEVDAYVIPIPYYDKNPDGTLGDWHYEYDRYPDYVPITSYREYNLEYRHPWRIFIHNPYDEFNFITTVHPDYYSSVIKDYTDQLIYIPYFIMTDIDPENDEEVAGAAHLISQPAMLNADRIIVQSEEIRQVYIKVLTGQLGESTREMWERKILPLGSPKQDRLRCTDRESLDIPEDWRHLIVRDDGSWKKIILYNTTVVVMLQDGQRLIEKIKDVHKVFKENQDEAVLLWRPHPLTDATIKSMRPELLDTYKEVVENYKREGWGIYDDSSDVDRAIILCDAYYGDHSSVVPLCEMVGCPAMIQNLEVIYYPDAHL